MSWPLYIRSLLLFGNIISIFRYIRAGRKLYKTTEIKDFNPFEAKTIFNEYQRQEEKIIYGYPLNIAQRETQNILFTYLKKEHDVHNILLGMYVRKDGRIKAQLIPEMIVLLLSLISVFGTVIIILIATVVVFNSTLPRLDKILISSLFFLFNGYIAYHFYHRFLRTTRSLIENHRIISKIL